MTPLLHGTWLAVCDGGRAMLLENVGDREYPKLEKRDTLRQFNPPAHEQGSMAAGRVFSHAHGQPAAVDETDYHQQAEEALLREFAGRIERLVRERDVRLVLVAPPRALGLLRAFLDEKTRNALAGELARDYVKLPLYEIERLLSAKQV